MLESLFMLGMSMHPLLQRKNFCCHGIKTLFKTMCAINAQLLISSSYTLLILVAQN